MPVTIPDEEPMVAFAVVLLVHVPPASISDRVCVAPTQVENVPVMVDGNGFIVMVVVATQPVFIKYVMIAVPAAMPVTTPLPAPIVATEGVLLVHETPVGDGSVKFAVEPTQIAVVPTMAAGSGLAVIRIVR